MECGLVDRVEFSTSRGLEPFQFSLNIITFSSYEKVLVLFLYIII